MGPGLSSFWARSRFERLVDFFRAGVELGFSGFEVSGLQQDTFYDEVRPGQFNIVSLHNPAPPRPGSGPATSGKAMREADLVLTSLDTYRRRQAVVAVRDCIDVALTYGAGAVVLHAGRTGVKPGREADLKRLFREGRIASRKADRLRERLLAERGRGRERRMEALRRSLDELAAYASARRVQLGIENRPISETPNFEDVGEILGWYPGDTVGYWHDTGHAQVQADLGFTPHADWLQAYGGRLVGLHLHDAAALEVHQAPGAGDVDWAGLARLVPRGTLLIMETDHTVSIEALRAGVRHLQSTGWA